MQRIVISAVVTILFMAALFVFYTYNPSEKLFFPSCPFLMATGHDCPGCGSQRAIHALLHLRLGDAFKYNALMVLLIPYILFGVYMQYLGGNRLYPHVAKILYGKWASIVLLVIIILFWILRNIW